MVTYYPENDTILIGEYRYSVEDLTLYYLSPDEDELVEEVKHLLRGEEVSDYRKSFRDRCVIKVYLPVFGLMAIGVIPRW